MSSMWARTGWKRRLEKDKQVWQLFFSCIFWSMLRHEEGGLWCYCFVFHIFCPLSCGGIMRRTESSAILVSVHTFLICRLGHGWVIFSLHGCDWIKTGGNAAFNPRCCLVWTLKPSYFNHSAGEMWVVNISVIKCTDGWWKKERCVKWAVHEVLLLISLKK